MSLKEINEELRALASVLSEAKRTPEEELAQLLTPSEIVRVKNRARRLGIGLAQVAGTTGKEVQSAKLRQLLVSLDWGRKEQKAAKQLANSIPVRAWKIGV